MNEPDEFPNASRNQEVYAWFDAEYPRLSELMARLVAVGNPRSKFSASEFHELHDDVFDVILKLRLQHPLIVTIRTEPVTRKPWTVQQAITLYNTIEALRDKFEKENQK